MKAPQRWEYQLGKDLIDLIKYADAHVPEDAVFISDRGKNKAKKQ